MLTRLQDAPTGEALIALVGLAGFLIACRAVVACRLGLAVIRTARQEDLPKALAAVRTVIDAAFRLRR